MEVLTPGVVPGFSKVVACTGDGNGGHGCKAGLRLGRGDLFLTEEFEREGGGRLHATFECPVCGKWTDLPQRPPETLTGPLPRHAAWVKARRAAATARYAAERFPERPDRAFFRDRLTGRLYELRRGDGADGGDANERTAGDLADLAADVAAALNARANPAAGV